VFSTEASLVWEERWQTLSAEQRWGFPPLCPDLVVEMASPSDEGPRGVSSPRRKVGLYQANGAQLGSLFYGFGRVNARKAVELALPPQPEAALVFQVVQDVPIADFQTATLALPVTGQGPLKTIKVAVDLDHTYIGDLVLKLLPPAALGIAPVVLHNQAGGSTDNIKKTYDEVNTPALTSLKGKDPSGTWTLEVADKARADTGTLRSLRLVLTF
jgi:subtilisin-like proprotein convertase family protein